MGLRAYFLNPIKTITSLNLAFMEKLGWRLVIEQESLWAKVITKKYVRGEIGLKKLNKKQGSSNTWRGIAKAHGGE